jgi:hypothetical protein
VAQQSQHGVGDQIGRCLVTGAEDEHGERHQLGFRQSLALFLHRDEGADQVVARGLPALGEDRPHIGRDLLEGALGRR